MINLFERRKIDFILCKWFPVGLICSQSLNMFPYLFCVCFLLFAKQRKSVIAVCCLPCCTAWRLVCCTLHRRKFINISLDLTWDLSFKKQALGKYCCLKCCFSLYPTLRRKIDYPFSRRDHFKQRSITKKKLKTATAIFRFWGKPANWVLEVESITLS